MTKLNLPIGFLIFHKNDFINYQINRWHSLGYTRIDDLKDAASKIKSFEDYKKEFILLAEKAEEENRLKNAAFYYRAAEFLTAPNDINKIPLYKKFYDNFYKGFSNEPIKRHKIKYGKSYIPAMELSYSESPKGIVLIHGGFDSFIEEFFCMWKFIAERGYKVIAFEGPGQGLALKNGLFSDHAWEKPVTAILDYFKIDNATLIGASFGGYWCMRAAAFEKRIKRVVAWAVFYDLMEQKSGFIKKLVRSLLKHRKLMNFLIKIKVKSSMTIKHVVNHCLYITGRKEPINVAEWLLEMNKYFLHSEKITQDVLLLAGEKDMFQPPMLLEKQKNALINAKSIESRIFMEKEKAGSHCQMGNLDLALSYITDWIDKKNEIHP